MERRIDLTGPVHTGRLLTALEAIPGLEPIERDGQPYARFALELPPGGVRLWVPKDADDAAIIAAFEAHDPTPDPEPEPETPPTEILLSLLQDVTDVDETKPILEAMLLLLGGHS